mmetsp:Transcript_22840/g.40776  ORF Transcript_22840/g.40776 Transcript_22840/m.40776 type:complete len:106 (-) Transcript_22840:8-325(-)
MPLQISTFARSRVCARVCALARVLARVLAHVLALALLVEAPVRTVVHTEGDQTLDGESAAQRDQRERDLLETHGMRFGEAAQESQDKPNHNATNGVAGSDTESEA